VAAEEAGRSRLPGGTAQCRETEIRLEMSAAVPEPPSRPSEP
jgi:hypothetical protein